MKVAELKKTIGGYRTEQLRRLLVEMYKAMPKRVKEDHGIDDMICIPASKRNNRESEVVPDIGALESETERFVSNAYNDYYYIPNSVAQRSHCWCRSIMLSSTGSQARAVTVGGLQFCAYSRTSIMQLRGKRTSPRPPSCWLSCMSCSAILAATHCSAPTIRFNPSESRKRIFFERCYATNEVMKIRETLFGTASSWP